MRKLLGMYSRYDTTRSRRGKTRGATRSPCAKSRDYFLTSLESVSTGMRKSSNSGTRIVIAGQFIAAECPVFTLTRVPLSHTRRINANHGKADREKGYSLTGLRLSKGISVAIAVAR